MDIAGLVPFWLVIGAALGIVANRFVRFAAHTRLWLDIGTGMFGALCAGVVFGILDVPRVDHFEQWSLAASAAGACVLLFLLRMYMDVPTPHKQ